MRVERIDEFDEDVIKNKLLDIYDRTSDSLWFSTTLNPDFFNQGEVKGKLMELANSGIDLRILLDGDVDVESRREEVEWVFEEPGIDIRQADGSILHRVISDNNDVRLEKKHTTAKGGPNLIVYNSIDRFVNHYRDEFNELWESEEANVLD